MEIHLGTATLERTWRQAMRRYSVFGFFLCLAVVLLATVDAQAVLVVDDGNAHAPTGSSGSIVLAPGNYHFETQFFECCGGPSGVDLTLPAGVTYSGPVNVQIFSTTSQVGGGAPYSGFVGAFTSADVQFATNNSFVWHPFGLGDFGADITGILNVSTGGSHTFSLNSDDGSLLLIDPVPLNAVPEPGTLLLFGSSLAGLGAIWRRRHRS